MLLLITSDRGTAPSCIAHTVLNPEHPNRDAWIEKAMPLLVNAISTPSDGKSRAIVGGKPVCERFVGPNCTDDFEMFHHNYLNVGYMMICLSNIAMAHFWLKRAGHSIPDAHTDASR